jgi:hypothetical protein
MRVVRRDEVRQNFRRASREPALRAKDVFMGDRDARQRTGEAFRAQRVGGACAGQAALVVDADKRVERFTQIIDSIEEKTGLLRRWTRAWRRAPQPVL